MSFNQRSTKSVNDATLSKAMKLLDGGLMLKRRRAVEAVANFEELREKATVIRQHTIDHMDIYLELFEKNAQEQGSVVHWCTDGRSARETILKICKLHGVRKIVKGKSMVSEEIHLNDFLSKHDIEALETDLGEYLVQLRGEAPSHILAPAIHITQEGAEETFRTYHQNRAADRVFQHPEDLVKEAREEIRHHYFEASMGITGANFMVADTGSTVIVTNEGNGDLCQHVPDVHLVITSIDKIIPNFDDMSAILRVLARSATGQDMSVYTTISSGTRRPQDGDGPKASHIVILDNGRSDLLGSDLSEMLRCIRCSACMNHCPVYRVAGGHAYNAPYVGPMGAVLAPTVFGLEQHKELPYASSFCGKCVEVCPVSIPLTGLMRQLRERVWKNHKLSLWSRMSYTLWGFAAKRANLYNLSTLLAVKLLNLLAGSQTMILRVPMVAAWNKHRHMPRPQKQTFQQMWKGPASRDECQK